MGNEASSDSPDEDTTTASGKEDCPAGLIGASFDVSGSETDEFSDDDDFITIEYSDTSDDESVDTAARSEALAAIAEMKEVVGWFLHPERPVARCVQGRNYFDRGSADVTWLNESEEGAVKGVVDVEEAEDRAEREEALAAVKEMKEVVGWFMHPERPVTSNGNCGRSYFGRPSAEVTWLAEIKGVVDVEEAEDRAEREEALLAVQEMRTTVSYFFHPERLVTTNGVGCRNYFNRPSSDITWLSETEPLLGVVDVEEAEDRMEKEEALAAVQEMRTTIGWFLHPERPVTTNGNCARNYFNRPSSDITWLSSVEAGAVKGVVDVEDAEDRAEREEALQAVQEMRTTIGYFFHPERPVTTNGVGCRNYFNRPSSDITWLSDSEPLLGVVDVEEAEDRMEKEEALLAIKEMKEVVGWFFHPERPVTTNGVGCRNYFNRPSSDIAWLSESQSDAVLGIVDVEEAEDRLEREEALLAIAEMKEVVSWFVHPGRPVTTNGFQGRCFFNRPSAPEQESKEEADLRAGALVDIGEQKEILSWFMHPERPINSSGCCNRNFFTRNAAPVFVETTTKRLRGESALDMFDLEGDETEYMPATKQGRVAQVNVNTYDANFESGHKQGELGSSPSGVMSFMDELV